MASFADPSSTSRSPRSARPSRGPPSSSSSVLRGDPESAATAAAAASPSSPPPRPRYDYLYCGSPLYGNLSPQRLREWMAYHVKLFGKNSHFVIHDASGVHPAVMEVLRPWIERGFVTLQDIREQERFDGYYHNQFLVVNDCLHRYKFMARWMFFFDVDEFIYIQPRTTLKSVLDSLSRYAQFTFEQMPMSGNLYCSSDSGKSQRRVYILVVIVKQL